LFQQGSENAPSVLQLIGSNKVVLFTGEEIKEQAFVGVWQAEVLKILKLVKCLNS
jgi:hypothetical protein